MYFFIIGNGFDRSLNLSTSYWDFRQYLEKHNKKVAAFFDAAFGMSPQNTSWTTLEASLGMINQTTINKMRSNNSFPAGYQWKKIISECKAEFAKWAAAIGNVTSSQYAPEFSFNDDDLFFNFNYTLSLENIFHVNPKQVLHIHGKANSPQSIVFGHGKKPVYGQKKTGTYDILSLTYKNTEKIIENNISFFNELNNKSIDAVIIIGHSIAAVDHRYFKKIHQIFPSRLVPWCAGTYNNNQETLQANLDACFIHKNHHQIADNYENQHFPVSFFPTNEIQKQIFIKSPLSINQ